MDMKIQKENKQHSNKLIENEMSGMNSAADEMQLNELIGTIVDSWRLIGGMVVLMLFIGVMYIAMVKPIYQADVLLQVEERSEGISGLAELSELLQEESPVTAEFEIIRSRLVLGSAVKNLKLDIIARPKHLPFVSFFIDPGTERIKVENFEVPHKYQGKPFKLIAGDDNKYMIFDQDENFLIQGEVGKPVQISMADDGDIKLFVSELSKKPGVHYELIIKPKITAINQLKGSLHISEQGKQSGILRMSLEGTSRGRITAILNEVANLYLRQSVERKSAEAEKTLLFLEKQLPMLKGKMESAEAALNNYRLQKGSVDLPLETQSTLEKIVTVDAQLTQLRSDREELIRQFTPEHPRIASIDAQILNLNRELRKVDVKVKGLPGTQQEILRLTRDLEVSSTLYTSLMNSAQELKVVKAGAVGNVRIVDYAMMPDRPVKPKKKMVIALMLVLGGLLGVGIALIRKSLLGAVEDPEIIEKKLGLPVFATIPHSSKQRKLNHFLRHLKDNNKDHKHRSLKQALLAVADSDDLAIESLRSLRTSLYFSKLNEKNNILLVTSPGPGAGKSFLCMNLAAVMADAGKRILVIDADLRKGRIHQLLGMQRSQGLSDIIAGEINFTDVIHKTDINNLFVLTVGTITLNPSELLMQQKFKYILEKISENFEYIIIDSPPVLAVTDATIIGSYAGATLLVVRDGQSPLREIEQSIKRLRQTNVNLRGVVYNGMKNTSSRYGYGKYYGYSYSYSDKKKS